MVLCNQTLLCEVCLVHKWMDEARWDGRNHASIITTKTRNDPFNSPEAAEEQMPGVIVWEDVSKVLKLSC